MSSDVIRLPDELKKRLRPQLHADLSKALIQSVYRAMRNMEVHPDHFDLECSVELRASRTTGARWVIHTVVHPKDLTVIEVETCTAEIEDYHRTA